MDTNPAARRTDSFRGAQLVGPLVARHAPALTLYARQLCADPEDAVQQAFIDLAAAEDPPREPLAWLYCAVRRKALTATRSKLRRKKYEEAAASQRPVWFSESPADRIDAQDVAETLQTLDQTDREVVVAHLWGGLTFRQVGELLGISGSSAFRRYESALVALRERMANRCTMNE